MEESWICHGRAVKNDILYVGLISFHSTPFPIKQCRLEGSHALFHFQSFKLSPSCWPKRNHDSASFNFDRRSLGLIGWVFVPHFRVVVPNLNKCDDPLEWVYWKIDIIWRLTWLLERLSSGSQMCSGACASNCFIWSNNAWWAIDTRFPYLTWGVMLRWWLKFMRHETKMIDIIIPMMPIHLSVSNVTLMLLATVHVN